MKMMQLVQATRTHIDIRYSRWVEHDDACLRGLQHDDASAHAEHELRLMT